MMNTEWALADENGNALVEFQTFIGCEVTDEGRVAVMPTEQGGFAAYNKVAEPIRITAELGLQGDDVEIQSALATIKDLKTGTTRFSLVTPDTEYQNMTVESYSYKRQREDGLNVCYVELNVVEVREVTPQYSTEKRLSESAVKKSDAADAQATGKTTGEKPKQSLLERGKSAVTEWRNKKNGLTVDSSSVQGR